MNRALNILLLQVAVILAPVRYKPHMDGVLCWVVLVCNGSAAGSRSLKFILREIWGAFIAFYILFLFSEFFYALHLGAICTYSLIRIFCALSFSLRLPLVCTNTYAWMGAWHLPELPG